MTHRNVLITGAGIAGPALAHWLGRRGMRAALGEQLTRALTRWWEYALLGRYKVPVPATVANMRLIERPPQRDPSPMNALGQTC
ncbi:hypothetical protein ACWGQ4_22710 [Streptomyces sp. NPDC055721]|uniref:hypothetical protein n=1 Tax=Streptomyces sp. NPDC127132 TaxID=3345374 RepID=UPI00363D5884